jgi:hypothetical protein
MELKEFVESTLLNIVEGVYSARTKVRQSPAAGDGAEVSPYLISHEGGQIPLGNGNGYAQLVDFDLALTVTEDKSAKGTSSSKVTVLSLPVADAGVDESSGTQTVHRIRFKVPVALPRSRDSGRERRQARAVTDDYDPYDRP